MADFLTRLAERALGVTPMVQPLIASMFAPEPTEHQLDLQWDGEEIANPGDSERVLDYSTKHISSTRNAPTDMPRDAAMNQQGDAEDLHQEDQHRSRRDSESRPEPPHGPEPASAEREMLVAQEDRQNSPSATNSRPQSVAGTRPESRRGAETGSLEPRATRIAEDPQNPSQNPPSRLRVTSGGSERPRLAEPASAEREMLVAQEDRQNSPSATNSRPQSVAGTRPESRRGAEASSLDHRTTPKEGSRQNVSRNSSSRSHETPSRPEPPPTESVPIQRDDAAPKSPKALHGDLPSAPAATESASVRAVPDHIKLLVEQVRGTTLASGSTPNVPALPDAQEPMVESQTLRDEIALPDAPLVKPEMVRSQLDEDVRRVPPGPHRLAPEPRGPTVRVNIGRIEVRAITPSPPPVRRPATARPGPVLSLDAYLKQRNEGQR